MNIVLLGGSTYIELYEYFFTDIWYLGNRAQPTASVYII